MSKQVDRIVTNEQRLTDGIQRNEDQMIQSRSEIGIRSRLRYQKPSLRTRLLPNSANQNTRLR